MTGAIDLNADLGEDESESGTARDIAMMEIVSSCNIACGGHAGSATQIEKMLVAADRKNVAAGAHPSYPDRENFGRVTLEISRSELKDSLENQLQMIKLIASKSGVILRHIKPHGALYNDAQDDEELADLLIELAMVEKLPLVGMPHSVLEDKAATAAIPYIAEGFIDRRYTAGSRLVPRSLQEAVIEQDNERLDQGMALASGTAIRADDGNMIIVLAQTLCLHSDSSGALETARKLRRKLEEIGIQISALNLGYDQ